MKMAWLFSVSVWTAAALIITGLTGCSGVELGGKVGLYKVDERESTERVATRGMPLKCWFVNCGAGEGSAS